MRPNVQLFLGRQAVQERKMFCSPRRGEVVEGTNDPYGLRHGPRFEAREESGSVLDIDRRGTGQRSRREDEE